MKTCLKVSTLVVALYFLLTGLAFAYRFTFGALRTEAFYEEKVSFGSERRFNLTRNQIQIPEAYGRLVTITASNKAVILWFESNDGFIRNVNVDAADPVIIDRKGELD